MNRKERRAGTQQGLPVPATSPAAQQAFLAGVQQHMAGRLAEAEGLYRQALAADPGHADSLHMLGMVAYQVDRADVALDLVSRAIAIQGRNSGYHADLSAVLLALGRRDEAVAAARRAVALKPDSPKAHKNLGYALQAHGKPADAAASLRAALRLKPADPHVEYNLGVLLQDLGKSQDAAAAYGRALALQPGFPEAMTNLGNALRTLGRPDEAVDWYRKALRLQPDLAVAHTNLGAVLHQRGDFQGAAEHHRKVTELRPDDAEAHAGLAIALHQAVRLVEAADSYRRAIDLGLALPDLYDGLGNALADLGDADAAIAAYRRAVELKPDLLGAWSNLLMALHYSDTTTETEVLAEGRRFAAQVEPPGGPPTFPNAREPERRLRIGYVSADFRTHPVGFFLGGVLPAHDRSRVEVFCYSNSAYADGVTARLQGAAEHWRVIADLPDAQAAAMIRADGIDILVDLAGHTAANRLPLFATRPAPVQATWLGYFGTTGLTAIDHIVTDRVVVPPGEEACFSEGVLRLPGCYLSYSAPTVDAPPAPFPAVSQGVVTFGCLNNRAKIGPQVVTAWAAILRRVEGSRLFLKARCFSDPASQAALRDAFAGHGIDGRRLILEGHSEPAQALTAYNRIDIALDPFPFGGCTTTAETLWMGVPLVTLAGGRWAGRMSQDILSVLGLDRWVAKDVEDYVELACAMAAGLPALAETRAGLRARLEASPFCDSAGFTRDLEAAYRQMWRGWCATQ